MQTLAFHRFAELFPLMLDADRAGMREDIREHGLREPIDVLLESVLDGRNRFLCLVDLVESGAPRGAGWGTYQGTRLIEDDLQPGSGNPLFRRYSPLEHGNALDYVISKNLPRRHLTDDQRRMVAAKLVTMGRGRPELNTAECGINREEAAHRLATDEPGVERARTVLNRGVEELQHAVERGDLSVNAASQIAKKSEEEQRDELKQRGIIHGATSPHMASRITPPDDLDYSPTPPWATRALFDIVLPKMDIWPDDLGVVWEPACGEGHMTGVFEEYPAITPIGSDIFDYSNEGRAPPALAGIFDFLTAPEIIPVADWIITNPPFNEKALEFALCALERAQKGVALFTQLRWLETIGRYTELFQPTPPTQIALFVERVPLKMRVFDPDGSTATSYVWIVWQKGVAPKPLFWIPPICRATLSKPSDRERFTAHPVLPIGVTASGERFDPATGEINSEEARGGEDVTAPDQTTREQAEAGEPSASGDDPASDPFAPLKFDKPNFTSDAQRASALGSMPNRTEDEDNFVIPSFLRHDSPERKALPEKRGC